MGNAHGLLLAAEANARIVEGAIISMYEALYGIEEIAQMARCEDVLRILARYYEWLQSAPSMGLSSRIARHREAICRGSIPAAPGEDENTTGKEVSSAHER